MTLEADTTQMLSPVDAPEVLGRLKKLVGDWRGINEDGEPVAVTYVLTANSTVVVEKWFFHNGMEALTLYHLDGPSLLATHYCPIGNQPRLILKGQTSDGLLRFEFVSATNLSSSYDEHEHGFALRFVDDETLWRSETYVTGGVPESNATLFHLQS